MVPVQCCSPLADATGMAPIPPRARKRPIKPVSTKFFVLIATISMNLPNRYCYTYAPGRPGEDPMCRAPCLWIPTPGAMPLFNRTCR